MSQLLVEHLPKAIANKSLQEIHKFQDYISPISITERRNILKTKTPRESAVLIVIYNHNDNLCFGLTQRQVYEGTHSGQISLPGGKYEEKDLDLSYTALRECKEEIGITVSKEHLIGTLESMYVPPSNFIISPYIAYLNHSPSFTLDAREVAELIHFPLYELSVKNITTRNIPLYNGHSLKANCYRFGEKIIWGATATILSELHWLLSTKGEKLAIQQMLNSNA